LKATLDVLVEEHILETLDGPKPEHGGRTPTNYRLWPGPMLPSPDRPKPRSDLSRSIYPTKKNR